MMSVVPDILHVVVLFMYSFYLGRCGRVCVCVCVGGGGVQCKCLHCDNNMRIIISLV